LQLLDLGLIHSVKAKHTDVLGMKPTTAKETKSRARTQHSTGNTHGNCCMEFNNLYNNKELLQKQSSLTIKTIRKIMGLGWII
jgi:hypothetical protein